MSKFVKLSSIAELTVGFVGTMAKHYEDEGIPFLRSLNMGDHMAMDMDTGDIHMISSWPDDDE